MRPTTRRGFLKRAAVSAGLAGVLGLPQAIAEERESAWLSGIDEYVESALANWKLPGLAVGIVRDGVVVHCRGYGVRSVGSAETVDHQTLFPIASCTKSFTAAAIAKLVDAEKVVWDDPIVKHLPEFQLATSELTSAVTIRHAVSHRTGLPTANMLWRRGDFGADEIMDRLRRLKPIAPPGERFVYNNNLYLVLGKLIGHVSGQSWSDYVQDQLIRPLGMSSTITETSAISSIENLATPHVLEDGNLRRIQRHVPYAMAPAGAIHSNVHDMTRWLNLQLGGGQVHGRRILSKARVAEMHTEPKDGSAQAPAKRGELRSPVTHYGLGWFFNEHEGHRVIEHSGTHNGYVSWVAMLPDTRVGVVIFGNCHRAGLVPAMKSWIFDAALNRPPRDWSEIVRADYANGYQRLLREAKAKFDSQRDPTTIPSVSLAKYAGEYRSDIYGTLRIQVDEDQLRLHCGVRFDARLEHWQHNSFRVFFSNPMIDDWLVTFSIKDGTVPSLRVKESPWAPAWYDDSDDLSDFVRV